MSVRSCIMGLSDEQALMYIIEESPIVCSTKILTLLY